MAIARPLCAAIRILLVALGSATAQYTFRTPGDPRIIRADVEFEFVNTAADRDNYRVFVRTSQNDDIRGFSIAAYIASPSGEFDYENPAVEITGFSTDAAQSPAGSENDVASLFNQEAVAFSQNMIEGGLQNTITPLEDRFDISVPSNCVANGIPLGANAGSQCEELEPQPFLAFDIAVPAGISKSLLFLGSGTVFGTILLNDPALFSQPRFSVEDLETASNTLLCEAGQSTGALTLFGRDNDNEVVATVASDHSADDCLVNGVAKETCRIFAYAISQTLLGASFAPQIANLSFELPSCVNAGNFHDIVGVEINSAPLPPSSLSVVQVTKLGSFETESQVLALKIDMFGLGDFPKPGQDFTVELIYDASFFLPADFPLRDVVNPFDHLVQISTFGKTATGAVCGPLYCSPYPSPVAPPPPPPAVSVCPEGASDSDKLGYTKERNEVTVIMLSDATIPTCVVGGKPESQCRQFCYGFLQSESNPSVKTNALESIKFESPSCIHNAELFASYAGGSFYPSVGSGVFDMDFVQKKGDYFQLTFDLAADTAAIACIHFSPAVHFTQADVDLDGYTIIIAEKKDQDPIHLCGPTSCTITPPPAPCSGNSPSQGFLVNVYVFGTITSMPDFQSLTPDYTFITLELNYPQTASTWEGFPVADNYAVRATTTLTIDNAGYYAFLMGSDDGSNLYIDGSLAISGDDSPGVFDENAKGLQMSSGPHTIEVHYYQKTASQGLVLRYVGPDTQQSLIALSGGSACPPF